MVTKKQLKAAQVEQKSGEKVESAAQTASTRENYWMMVLLYFASFLVGLGIVAEVAANWQAIPNAVKLGGALVAMLINSGAVWWTMKTDKPILKQVFACIYAFLIMGVIGLIGQIYHLHSHMANACLLWSLISWPLILIAPRLLWLWTPLFFFGCRYMPHVMDDLVIEEVLGSADASQQYRFNNTILNFLRGYLAFVFILIYELWVNFDKKQDKTVINPLRFYSGMFLLNMYSFVPYFARALPQMDAQLQMPTFFRFVLPYVITAGIVYFLNNKTKRKSFMPLFLIGVIIQQAYVSLSKEYSSHSWWSWQEINMMLPIVFCLLMAIYAKCHKMPRLFKLSVMAIIFWFVGTFENHIFDLLPSLIICAVICLLAYRLRSRRWFNTGVILAVIRILCYYGDVENLEHLGLYLIGAGILIIATILLLMKYSKVLWEKKDEH
ncbi:MAG: DUF2157 domain-containing protein [Alphaproteobacteria bacterium]|nr:DUF2157 domain-containing protein [Alphaproteobacteria bacterium]